MCPFVLLQWVHRLYHHMLIASQMHEGEALLPLVSALTLSRTHLYWVVPKVNISGTH